MAAKSRVTIKEVARLAGVSTATVSAVLNGTPVVSPKRTQQVHKAMEALDYHPDALGRGLRTRRTQVAGVLIPDITNPFFAEVIRGVEDAAALENYSVIVCNTNENAEQEQRQLTALLSGRTDGLLITCANQTANYDFAVRRNLPIVFMDHQPVNLVAPLVATDHFGGAYDATRHLIDLGHKQIALMARDIALLAQAERVEGFRKAMQMSDLPIREDYFRVGGKNEQDGYTFACDLLRLQQPPTAIFSCNNKMLAGLLRAVGELGIRCPAELSVIGFDDHIWVRAFTPPVSVVAQDAYNIGSLAMKMLLDSIFGRAQDGGPHTVLLPCRLMLRSTTAEPRAKELSFAHHVF